MTTNEKNHIRALRLFSERQYDGHHFKRVREHYASAREKHPYFCDKTFIDEWAGDFAISSRERLADARQTVDMLIAVQRISAEWLLRCEWREAEFAFANGDKAQAVEELYDCIAVCLRAIDVIEGRQKLGKPEEGEGK